MSIILFLTATLLPIINFIGLERQQLQIKREIVFDLHDNLLQINREQDFTRIIQNHTVFFSIDKHQNYWKGCASWKSERGKPEKICLYRDK